jgi:opine dehydrogenase
MAKISRRGGEGTTSRQKELSKEFGQIALVTSTKQRFISEDIPYGMVTIALLADMVGVETPFMDAVINISCVINESDYWKEGRTLEKLGIAGLSLYELRKFLDEG